MHIRRLAEGESPWPLFLYGGVGVGKTCAALALCDAVGGGCKHWTVNQVVSELSRAMKGELYDQVRKINESYWWNDYGVWTLTVIDEIGARDKTSDFECDTLRRLVDERHGKPCVFISNLGPERLAEVYDERVVSRLCQGTVVEAVGRDRRMHG